MHETGAVEATGHKVLPCAAKDGKVTPEGVEAVCALHTDEHMVAPRLLYISQPTEIGTVYHLDELKALRRVCDAHGLILFVDGARLGSGLTSPECDMTLKDLAALADCFYIGGTKNGLLFGEAMVIVNPALQKDFRFMIKHNGGMIAKGRLGGVMFLAALEHDDYFAWAQTRQRDGRYHPRGHGARGHSLLPADDDQPDFRRADGGAERRAGTGFCL